MTERRESKPYTREALLKAEKLHKQGLTWGEAAKRIGHSGDSLRNTRAAFKAGRVKKTRGELNAEDAKRLAYVEELISLGASPVEIRKMLKISISNLSNRFSRWGLDREMRIQLRLERTPRLALLFKELKSYRKQAGAKHMKYSPQLLKVVHELLVHTELTAKKIAQELNCDADSLTSSVRRKKNRLKDEIA